MLKIKVALVLVFLNIFGISNANAVWNGNYAINDTRTVPILFNKNELYCATGWLYSPRIVLTAAHITYYGNDLTYGYFNVRKSVFVGMPGSTINYKNKIIESEKIFVSKNFTGRTFWRGGDNITRQNDFSVIVLKKPIKIDNKAVELLTPELHSQYIENNEQVTITGYGAQNKQQLNQICYKRKPASFIANVYKKNIDLTSFGNFQFTTTLNFKVNNESPDLCDGDSGAGYIKILKDKYIYLGAAGAGAWDSHNCKSRLDISNAGSINGSDPVYNHIDLIKEAEQYIKDSAIKKNMSKK